MSITHLLFISTDLYSLFFSIIGGVVVFIINDWYKTQDEKTKRKIRGITLITLLFVVICSVFFFSILPRIPRPVQTQTVYPIDEEKIDTVTVKSAKGNTITFRKDATPPCYSDAVKRLVDIARIRREDNMLPQALDNFREAYNLLPEECKNKCKNIKTGGDADKIIAKYDECFKSLGY